jgi:cytochrome b6-f complex iron-sulfur subunit
MPKTGRRKFLEYFLGGSLVGTLVSFLYPVIRYLIPPKTSGSLVDQVVAAKVGKMAPNSYKIFKFGNSPGILIDTPEGEFKSFTAICTHLACTVRYDSETQTIHCPCHNGRFDLSGNVLSGPPPAPLEEYIVKVVGEDILVSKKR